MLPRKLSCLLNAVVVTLLVSGSHTALAKVGDSWENRAPQITEAQKAADKAREDRMAEMRGAIAARKGAEATPDPKASSEPEKKPAESPKTAEAVQPKPHTPHTAMAKPAHKPLSLQEQIALNRQKKAEELRKTQEMNKAAGGAAKPMTWQERARLAREARLAKEAGMKAKPETKDGVAAHTKPPAKEEAPVKAAETVSPKSHPTSPPLKMTVEEHEHIVTTLPMPSKVDKPAEKPAVTTEKKEVASGDEPVKQATNIPAPPKGGPKPLAMSPTQRRMMAAQEKTVEAPAKAVESAEKPVESAEKPLAMSPTQRKMMASQEKADSADKPKLSFLDQIKQRGQTPPTTESK